MARASARGAKGNPGPYAVRPAGAVGGRIESLAVVAGPPARDDHVPGAFPEDFFHLTTEERRQTVQSLGPSERRQMEQALRSYATLPPAMQSECVESFGKFAGMSVDERNQFLQNAAKWERMSVEERKLWRTLVDRLPPAPPGFIKSYPPMPPGMPAPFTSNAGLTNAPETARGEVIVHIFNAKARRVRNNRSPQSQRLTPPDIAKSVSCACAIQTGQSPPNERR